MPYRRLKLEAAPEELFQALRRGPFATWLDSSAASCGAWAEGDVPSRYRYGRYSYIYTEPSAVFTWRAGRGRLRWPGAGGLAERLLTSRDRRQGDRPAGGQDTGQGPFVPRLLQALRAAAGVGCTAAAPVPEAGCAEDWWGVALTGHPLAALRALLGAWRTAGSHAGSGYGVPPVQGAAVGYLAYDLGRYLERLPARAADELGLPELHLALYPVAYAYDHQRQAWFALSVPARDAAALLAAAEKEAAALGDSSGTGGARTPGEPFSLAALARGDAAGPVPYVTRADYEGAVQRVREYIAAGDVFQVNLSQRFSTAYRGDPFRLYRRLRRVSPEPYAAFVETPEVAICCASPELFLEVRGRRVVTRPIKGTRPRGASAAEDRRLAAELEASAKDRAELLMITDLERNDLGRVCETGSVEVPSLVALEAHPQVYHLVSTVTGLLKPAAGLPDLLAASFPGGSITGAPKIRSMEIIEELEPVRRGPYTGAIGQLGFNGSMDLNIVIRTIWCAGGKLYLQVGGGIVADSDPAAEYVETLHKARGLLEALASVNPAAAGDGGEELAEKGPGRAAR